MSERQQKQLAARASSAPARAATNVTATTAVTAAEREDEYIDLTEFLFKLVERWKLILALALVFGIAVGLYTYFFITPLYRATATIYVLSRRDSAINMADLQIGTALTSDYIKVFKMWEVHGEVISNLALPYSYSQIQSMLSVVNDTGTRMLDISITSKDPQEAADIANEYARVASQYIADTMATEKPNIMSVARVPANPVSPSMTRNVAIGVLLGIMLGAAIVFIQMQTDDKYKTSEDIKRYTGLVTLAMVPYEDDHDNNGRTRSRNDRR